jgi:biotin-independent malonate decarboxylase gamma subunit
MNDEQFTSFGTVWFDALEAGDTAHGEPGLASIRSGDVRLGDEAGVLLAVVPDPIARFPRARHGEVGLAEGWGIARAVREVVSADLGRPVQRPIVVVVDVPSQAYGYTEELAGVHQSLAASADALATARLAGHPVTALIVGKAISGAFLAVGLQANRIISLDHEGIVVQVMSKLSAGRITRRTVEQLDAIAAIVPSTAYDGASFARLGAVHEVLHVDQPSAPSGTDIARVLQSLTTTTADIRAHGTGLESRLTSAEARVGRAASITVREMVAAAWNG